MVCKETGLYRKISVPRVQSGNESKITSNKRKILMGKRQGKK
jgi:hypothetical protein